jgi:hypothetical protein
MREESTYQFRITLSDDPPVWRTIVIPHSFAFNDFHNAIQDAMGWKDYHLYEFSVKNPLSGQNETIGLCEDESCNNTDTTTGIKRSISEVFSLENRSAKYVYDFGDNWVHYIELEKISKTNQEIKTPICLKRVGSCPPEDCGGLSEYLNLLNLEKGNKSLEEKRDQFGLKLNNLKKSNKYIFHPQYVHFRNRSTKKSLIKEDCYSWMRRLTHGKIGLVELVQDVNYKIPSEDIRQFMDCIENESLSFRNRAVAVLSLYKEIPIDIISEYLFVSTSMVKNNYKIYLSNGIKSVISDKGKRLPKHQDQALIDKVFLYYTPHLNHTALIEQLGNKLIFKKLCLIMTCLYQNIHLKR